MTQDDATTAVREVLQAVYDRKRRGPGLPHGFRVRDVAGAPRRNLFMPTLDDGWTVTAELEVPVIYSKDYSTGRARATLPAARENLDTLKAWICDQTVDSWAQIEIVDWRVEPDQAPPPRPDHGHLDGPPAQWTVTATFAVS